MKWAAWLLTFVFLISGCSSEDKTLEQGMAFRSSLLSAKGCTFSTKITADYGDAIHVFSMDCRGDDAGTLTFCISEPDTISGISGTISDTGGQLLFDDTVLCFPLMTDNQFSPVSAPWIFLKTLRSGYITSACMEDEMLHLIINDSYEDDALQLDIWMDEHKMPVRSDILYDSRRILSLEIEGFVFQ